MRSWSLRWCHKNQWSILAEVRDCTFWMFLSPKCEFCHCFGTHLLIHNLIFILKATKTYFNFRGPLMTTWIWQTPVEPDPIRPWFLTSLAQSLKPNGVLMSTNDQRDWCFPHLRGSLFKPSPWFLRDTSVPGCVCVWHFESVSIYQRGYELSLSSADRLWSGDLWAERLSRHQGCRSPGPSVQ